MMPPGKITKYKIQITNKLQNTNYKLQIKLRPSGRLLMPSAKRRAVHEPPLQGKRSNKVVYFAFPFFSFFSFFSDPQGKPCSFWLRLAAMGNLWTFFMVNIYLACPFFLPPAASMRRMHPKKAIADSVILFVIGFFACNTLYFFIKIRDIIFVLDNTIFFIFLLSLYFSFQCADFALIL
jgi:hypothetical protein